MPISDSTQRFSSRVDDYVRHRPGYPSQILDTLKNDCGLTGDSVIADIGSGTGFLSRIFLENGNGVFGVEPNREMRAAGERLLQGFNHFTSVEGTAEETGLAEHSVDFVTAGQAAHWFDREKANREFQRILKPGGWVVLVWNDRDFDSTPLARAYEQLLRTYGVDYDQVHRVGFDTVQQINAFFAPAAVRVAELPNRQEFDYAGLVGRVLSASYMPQKGHPSHQPMLQELRRIFDAYQHGGRVVMEYATRMYYAQIGRQPGWSGKR
jgi:SAM-dependent methyltransferase